MMDDTILRHTELLHILLSDTSVEEAFTALGDVVSRLYPSLQCTIDLYDHENPRCDDSIPLFPIHAGSGTLIGALHLDGAISPNPDQRRLLQSVTKLAGIAHDRRRAEQAVVERERLAGLATSISRVLTMQAPLQAILQACAETIVSHLGVAFARIWLLDDTGETLVLKASAGLYTNLFGSYSRVPVKTSLKIGRMVIDRRPRLTNRLDEEGWVKEPDWAKREGFIAYAGYPLIVQDRVVGVLAMFSRRTLSDRTLDELGAISGGMAQCILRGHAEDALRESEERLSLAVEGVGMAMWDWNLRTGAVVWSDQQFALLGYDRQAVQPSMAAWQARVHPDDLSRVMAELTRSRENRTLYCPDYRIVRADTQEVVWAAARGRYLYDAAGDAIRMIGGNFNITPRKRTEEHIERLLDEARRHQAELREKQAQLVQAAKLASIGELTTGVAHELNNPLNNITLYVGNVLDLVETTVEGPIKSHLVEQLHGAEEQIRRAAAVINHLRTFARTAQTTYEAVSVNEMIESSLKMFHQRFRHENIDVRSNLTPDKPVVHGSPLQLEQVMINLFSNAADAMKDLAIKRLTIETSVQEKHVNIAVRDTGTGIEPDNLPRIFDPFYTTKEVGAGTGLGLAITYGIVKDHQGQIAVESTIGHGTRVVVTLPIHELSSLHCHAGGS